MLSTSKCHGCKPDPVSFPNTGTFANGRLPPALGPLMGMPNWVLWRGRKRTTSVPKCHIGRQAQREGQDTDPRTWSDFAIAVAAAHHADGMGLCSWILASARSMSTTAASPHRRASPVGNSVRPACGSYTEMTVTGTGIRIIGYGTGDKVHRKQMVIDGSARNLSARLSASSS